MSGHTPWAEIKHKKDGLQVRSSTWLISDTHFGHDNIIKFQQRPKNHEIHMLGLWLKLVRENDTILHLGDVTMSAGREVQKYWLAVIKRLPGRKYLLLGNHDKQPAHVYEEYGGFTVIPEFVQARVAFTHRPISNLWPAEQLTNWVVNVHGHTHSNVPTPEHDGILFDKMYVNVCVEHTNLGPVQVGNLLPGWDWRAKEEISESS